VFDGIRFVEGRPAEVQEIAPVTVSIGGVLRSAQLRNLDDVKREMAEKARIAGGNAVIEFRYGQKSVGFLASLFQRDDVNWYGSGIIALIPKE
jgi:hypothetical protein